MAAILAVILKNKYEDASGTESILHRENCVKIRCRLGGLGEHTRTQDSEKSPEFTPNGPLQPMAVWVYHLDVIALPSELVILVVVHVTVCLSRAARASCGIELIVYIHAGSSQPAPCATRAITTYRLNTGCAELPPSRRGKASGGMPPSRSSTDLPGAAACGVNLPLV